MKYITFENVFSTIELYDIKLRLNSSSFNRWSMAYYGHYLSLKTVLNQGMDCGET